MIVLVLFHICNDLVLFENRISLIFQNYLKVFCWSAIYIKF